MLCTGNGSLRVALVVGTILNILNQGQAVLDGGAVSWFQLVTNYLVPYCVATYSAAKNEMARSDIG